MQFHSKLQLIAAFSCLFINAINACSTSEIACGSGCISQSSMACWIGSTKQAGASTDANAKPCPLDQSGCLQAQATACYDPKLMTCTPNGLQAIQTNTPPSVTQQIVPAPQQATATPPPAKQQPWWVWLLRIVSFGLWAPASAHQAASSTFDPSFALPELHDSKTNNQITQSSGSNFNPPSGYEKVWGDEFTGDSLNTDNWHVETSCSGGGNNEFECYTSGKDTLVVANGILNITAISMKGEKYDLSDAELQNCNDPLGCKNIRGDVKSGRIRSNVTSDKGSWTYGYFAGRILNPKGDFLWPALWLLPTDAKYGIWAASGEIDIMEAKGQENNVLHSSLQYGASWPNNKILTTATKFTTPINDEWHVYGCEWTPEFIDFQIDGVSVYKQNTTTSFYGGQGPNPYTQNGQPWDQRFHWILNLAVGGGFFTPEKFDPVESPKTWERPTMQVDWVRVYQKPKSTGSEK